LNENEPNESAGRDEQRPRDSTLSSHDARAALKDPEETIYDKDYGGDEERKRSRDGDGEPASVWLGEIADESSDN